MSKIACLFPGQGSQSVGMGKDLHDNNAVARSTFEQSDHLAGRSLSTLCFAGPEEELKRTINTQPTILAVSLAAWRCYEAAGGPKPAFAAGHSLGEITALTAAGALSLQAAVPLVDRRARLMEECPTGAMSAVIGICEADLQTVCQESSRLQKEAGAPDVVIIANYNTMEQLVISGSPEAVKLAGELAKSKGARVIALPVGGAFHSPLMAEAAKAFEHQLEQWQFQDAQFPIVQNVDALACLKGDQLKAKLASQMPSAVRWTDTIKYMLSQGVDTFVEIGPGKALAGMVKKIDRQARVCNIFDSASLQQALGELSAIVVL